MEPRRMRRAPSPPCWNSWRRRRQTWPPTWRGPARLARLFALSSGCRDPLIQPGGAHGPRSRRRKARDPAVGAREAGPAESVRACPHGGALGHRPEDPRAQAGPAAASARWCAPRTSAGMATAIPIVSRACAIPLPSRIVAVCDAFDAMTSKRAYRRSITIDAALDELRARRRHPIRPRRGRAVLRPVRESN